MSNQPQDNASISLKRKRAPVLPIATRSSCEEAIMLLITCELITELNPLDVWRIQTSTEVRGTGFQYELKL